MQVRSTARLSGLLDAAARVIDEIGYERLTTAMVAEGADASIGTVYRYFPDRIAVLQGLSVRTLNQFSAKLTTTLNEPKLKSWLDVFDAVVSDLVEAYKTVPGFRSLRFGDVIDIGPGDNERTGNGILAGRIAEELSQRFGLVNDDDLRFRFESAVDIAEALLARAFRFDKKGDSRFITETRAVVRAYLTSHYPDAAETS